MSSASNFSASPGPANLSSYLTGDHPGFAQARAAAAELRARTGINRHRIAVVLGSGWGETAEKIGHIAHRINTAELPGFPEPVVAGHNREILSIRLDGAHSDHDGAPYGHQNNDDAVAAQEAEPDYALVFGSRTHYYESRDAQAVAHTVRTAAAAGAEIVILTNGCGGLMDGVAAGTPVLISDHINLTGDTPLHGPEFIDLTDLYSPRVRALAQEIDPSLQEGVYVQFAGPQYETPAEVRMAKTLGGDLVGMSTALDAIAARHAGLEVFGISLVTNPAAGTTEEKLSHEEVIAAGQRASKRCADLLARIVGRL